MRTWWQRKTIGVDGVLMWVLGLLVVGVFLLWATAGRAEVGWYTDLPFVSDEKVMKEIIQEAARSGQTLHIYLYEFNEKTELWDRARPPACLARMEAAMRAMEPVTPWKYWLLPRVPGQLPDGVDLADLYQQWDAVKRECWRKP